MPFSVRLRLRVAADASSANGPETAGCKSSHDSVVYEIEDMLADIFLLNVLPRPHRRTVLAAAFLTVTGSSSSPIIIIQGSIFGRHDALAYGH